MEKPPTLRLVANHHVGCRPLQNAGPRVPKHAGRTSARTDVDSQARLRASSSCGRGRIAS